MLEELNLLTEQQRNTYRAQPSRMVADYKREGQLIGEYNGRQLLEMLQNADDQGSLAVQIRLDEDAGALTIANQGVPFTVAGVESLMIANLSTKPKARYIGNKGLGFRSILNWADHITIDSGAVSVTFGEHLAEKAFNELFDPEQQRKIRVDASLSPASVPMAILALPHCAPRTRDGWVTEITLRYRADYVADVKEQLDAIDATCLLFLNNIDLIVIEHGGQQRRLERTVTDDIVRVNGATWAIYGDEALLPDEHQDRNESEPQRYSLKLALTPELDQPASVLYTYFPTRVPIAFPMVIHGTFDLDSSRNQLIKSDRNKYLLGRLVDLILKTASTLRERQSDPWIQVRLLQAGDPNPVLQQLGFYQTINQRMAGFAIFPCVDGQYRRADEVYYLGEAFSQFVFDSGCGTLFPALVRAGEPNALHKKRYRSFVPTKQFTDAVNAMSSSLSTGDLVQRVALIDLLCETKEAAGRYALLVNQEFDLIDADTDAYTPLTSGLETLAIPSFVNIDFIHKGLFEALVARYASLATDKARVVERKLKEITNIHSYEPAPVIRTIVRGTNDALSRQTRPPGAIVSEMVASLLNYISLRDRQPLPLDFNPPLMNVVGQVTPARSLYLSASYPTGEHVERLFADVYRPEQFVAPPAVFGPAAETADPALLERFFGWLGVNRFVRFEQVKHVSQSCAYVSHVLKIVGRPDAFRDAAIECRALPEKEFKRMRDAMTPEQIVEWLLRDDAARALLAPDHTDKFSYSKIAERHGTAIHELTRKPSYLSYQLGQARPFEHYVLEVEQSVAHLVNPVPFDFSSPWLARTGATKREIESLLLHLGASERIDQLPLKRVATILRDLPERDPEGRLASRLYRHAMRHFDVHNRQLPPDVLLLARKGTHAAYHPQHEIFYSDNVRLPARIVRDVAMLDYPRRAGGLKVPAFFGVKNLNTIVVKVERFEPLPALAASLSATLREKLPYLLAYRLRDFASDAQGEAKKLANLSVMPCAGVTYAVDGASSPLDLYEHVREGTTHLVQVERTISFTELMSDRRFCDTFADIVSSLFGIAEHWSEFRSVFRDDLAEVDHLARRELKDEAILEARRLLGVAEPATAFWAALGAARLGGTAEAVTPAIVAGLRAELTDNGVDVDGIDADLAAGISYTDRMGTALKGLGVSVQSFNARALYKVDLVDTHRARLIDYQLSRFIRYKDALWHSLCAADWNGRGTYLDLLAAAERPEWANEVAVALGDQIDLDYEAAVARHLPIAQQHVPPAQSDRWFEEQWRQLGAEAVISLRSEQRSLLYFEGGLAQVLAYLNGREESTLNAIAADTTSGATISPIPEDAAQPVAAPTWRGGKPRAGGSPLYDPAVDMQRHQNGVGAEQVVVASLIALYGASNVEYVAQRVDGAGYDARYRRGDGETWRYVEVKRYTGNRIFITANERDFASNHKGEYEIFLVDANDRITVLRDIDFDDRSRFNVEPREFVVSFELNAVAQLQNPMPSASAH